MIGSNVFGTRASAIAFTFVIAVVAIALPRMSETRIVHAGLSTPQTGPLNAIRLGDSIRAGTRQNSSNDDQNYVVAMAGKAFALEETADGIRTTAIVTSRPVFKAFGLAPDGRSLLYTPLTNGVPSGELYIEDIYTGNSRKISTHLVIEATWSPMRQNEVAYTFSKGDTFGLAVVSVDSGDITIVVTEHVLPDILQWAILGDDIYYFEVDNTLEQPVVVAKVVDVQTRTSAAPSESELPSGFPNTNSAIPNVPRPEFQKGQDSTHPFHASTADGLHQIWGDDLLGNSMLYARTVSSDTMSPIGKGQVLKLLRGGVIVREFTDSGTRTVYVPWNGPATELGPAVTVNFNLPLAGLAGQSFVVSQGGASYPPPGACGPISSHTGSSSFAYDMQRFVVGAHVLASAAGQVTLVTSTVTCNSFDTDCPDYSASCTSSFGNTVVIQHADGTYTRYAHMQANSVQVSDGATVCQGQYIGRQGHTGKTCCTFNQCGDHLHFQRQQLSSGSSISISFSDVSSNPLSCGTSYASGSTETTSCSSCSSGSSESYRALGNRPPIHPNGTLIKVAGDATVYLIRGGQKMWVTSPSLLANLYQQANSNFSTDVITVASDELNRYPTGANVGSALPSNGRGQPEGRLIRQSGGTEVSIVTDGGHRRPFATSAAFLGLGYQFCKVVDVADYFSYPQGPPVEAMPIITSSISLSPPAPYSVGQTITGAFSLTNIGTSSITFAVVTVGGRLNGSTVRDFPFHTNVTLAPGQMLPYQDTFTFSQAGSYSFFPAYQTQDAVWRLGLNHEIPADPGVNDLVTFNVTNCNAPGTFSLISPSNGQSLASTSSLPLSWGTSANANSYDVYFGTSSNPPFLANQAGTSRSVNVTAGQTYFWKVVARVSCNASLTFTAGVWSFSVQSCNAPGSFSLISPTNGQSLSQTSSVPLSWGTSANANSYDVYFGTSSNPPFLANQAGTSRSVNVTAGLTYFWKVVARVSCNASLTFTSAIWSFSVQSCNAPGAFSLVSPSNGQSLSQTSSVPLSWGTSANANSYDVYFGTSSNPPFLANQTGTSRSVSVTPGQSYFWKVVALVNCNASLTFTAGIWSFSVQNVLQADLIVTALTAPSSGSIGGQITVSSTVANQGSANAGAFRLGYYFSTDSAITAGDIFTGWICDFPSGLAAGTSGTCSGPIGVPSSLAPGTYFFGAIVDDLGQVAENNEANNARPADTGPITLAGCTATPIGLGQTVNGALTTSDCRSQLRGNLYYADRYTFTGSAGQQVSILLSSSFDTFLYLIGPSGSVIAEDDDGGGGTNSRIPPGSGFFTLPSSGAYIIETTSFDQNATGNYTLGLSKTPFDFDGDGKADLAVYRNNTGQWLNLNSSNGQGITQSWGFPSLQDEPVPADYDGDGKADRAVYRNLTGQWLVLNSSNGQGIVQSWGFPSLGDIPVPADYDGDGKADIAVYRSSTGQWLILNSSNGQSIVTSWGFPSLLDVPIPADYDGDGKSDVAVYRSSTGQWLILNSSNGQGFVQSWGFPSLQDKPVPADYDGDGKADKAVYRNLTGQWLVLNSSNGQGVVQSWGYPSLGDMPAPADYDGDRKTDIAVYRSSTGQWLILNSSNGQGLVQSWGFPSLGDIALPTVYIR